MRLHKGITHLSCKRLKLVESAFLVTCFEFGKDGFIVRLTSLHEVIEDAGKFVSRILDGLGCTMAGALRSVIVAQIRLVVVKGLSSHAKDLRDAILGFDLGTADAASGTVAIFGTEV